MSHFQNLLNVLLQVYIYFLKLQTSVKEFHFFLFYVIPCKLIPPPVCIIPAKCQNLEIQVWGLIYVCFPKTVTHFLYNWKCCYLVGNPTTILKTRGYCTPSTKCLHQPQGPCSLRQPHESYIEQAALIWQRAITCNLFPGDHDQLWTSQSSGRKIE